MQIKGWPGGSALDSQTPVQWASGLVAFAATAAAFLSGLVAGERVLFVPDRQPSPPTVVAVRLTPPPSVVQPTTLATPVASLPSGRPLTPVGHSTTPLASTSIDAPVVRRAAALDTTTRPDTSPIRPRSEPRPVASPAGARPAASPDASRSTSLLGAPITPAGIVLHSDALSAASAASAAREAIRKMAREGEFVNPRGSNIEAYDPASSGPATPGVHPSNGVSINIAELLFHNRDEARRKRDSIVDADYRARLERLQARAAARDSIRRP